MKIVLIGELMKKVMLLVGFVLLNGVIGYTVAGQKSEALAPLTTLSLGADQLDLQNYRGKVVLLDFWASWCGPCRQSFPWMNLVYEKYKDQGFAIIAINLDQEKKAAAGFLAAVPAFFKILYDPVGSSAEQMAVRGMPVSYLIDRKGHVSHRLIGFNSAKKKEHEAHIIALLNEAI